jgi:hypothetical protein
MNNLFNLSRYSCYCKKSEQVLLSLRTLSNLPLLLEIRRVSFAKSAKQG